MGDPPRLRAESNGLEALLLRTSRRIDPPEFAEDEVWRRLEIATAAGAAAGATGLAASTVAGSKLAAKTGWVAVLKWAAVTAVGLPVLGVATDWAVRRHVATTSVPAHVGSASSAAPRPASAAPDAPLAPLAPLDLAPLAPRAASPRARSGGIDVSPRDPASTLKKESTRLGVARAKFAAGDPRGALDEVARLGVEFPRGALVQEREVLAIDCLQGLGDDAGARARALAFLDRFPVSPYAAHVRHLVGR